MAKTKKEVKAPTKKVAKETVDKVVEKVTKDTAPKIVVSVRMNGQVYTIETLDIKEAFLSLQPQWIKTKVVVTCEYLGRKFERMMFINPAKMLFSREVVAEVFAKQVKTILNVK